MPPMGTQTSALLLALLLAVLPLAHGHLLESAKTTEEIENALCFSLYPNVTSLVRYSGKLPGDLGDWWSCTHELQDTRYAMLTVADPGNPICLGSIAIPYCNVGVCAPSTCTEEDLQSLAVQIWFQATEPSSIEVNWGANNALFTSTNWTSLLGIAVLAILCTVATLSTLVWMLSQRSLSWFYSREMPVELGEEIRKREALKSSPDTELILQEPDEEIVTFDTENKTDIEEPSFSLLDLKLEEEPEEPDLDNETITNEEMMLVEQPDPGMLYELQNPSKKEAESGLLDRVATILPEDSTVVKVAKSFAVNYNMERLFHPVPGDFRALNGARFISMLWIIWGHTLFFWSFIGVKNPSYAYGHAIKVYWIQVIMGAIFAVDTFFFISGFLVTYFVYESFVSGKKMQWFLYYFHRVWRILPLYIFLMILYIYVVPILGNGPYWFSLKEEISSTSKYFWTNLLFLNNFYPDPQQQCMGWTWFLAVDMQFYIVSPFLILLQYKKPVLGWITLAILVVIDITTTITLSSIYGFSASRFVPQPEFFNTIYQKPYCRMSPYIVGMATAYLYSYIRRNRPNLKIQWWAQLTGFCIALTIMYSIIYGAYDDWDWAQWKSTLYLGLSRFGWGLSLGYIMLMSFLGYGGIVHRILTFRWFEPLGKLTYAAYLIHPMVIDVFYYSQWEYLMFEYKNMMYFFFGHALCSFSVAVFAYLVVEKPVMNIEPIILGAVIERIKKRRGLHDSTEEH